jgi:hypothetical protein
MDIVKNPVILGLVAGVLTYLYMKWNKNEEQKEGKKGKGKKNKNKDKDEESEYTSLIIPAVVAAIIWFMAYGYFEYSKPSSDVASVQQTLPNIPGYKLVKDASSSDQVRSFSLINKGVKIPNTLPDVFIETF